MAKKASAKDDLKLLFDRPREPLFAAKDNGKVSFDVPQDYYTDRYKPIGISLVSTRADVQVQRTVTLRTVTKPNLDFAKSVKVRGPFSLFNRKHQEIAGQLTGIFLDAPDVDTLLSTAAYVKDRVNPYLFQVSINRVSQIECIFLTIHLVRLRISVCVGSGNATSSGHKGHYIAVDRATVSRSICRLVCVSVGT